MVAIAILIVLDILLTFWLGNHILMHLHNLDD